MIIRSLLYFLMFFPVLLFAQPANDDCSGATSVPQDGTCVNGTLNSAGDSWTGEVGCATAGGANGHRDVWYTFVSTGTQADFTITAGTLAGNIELVLVTPTGSPDCSNPFSLVNSSCSSSPLQVSFFNLNVGQTYYYTVSSPGNSAGTFTTCLTTSSPPPSSNQDCPGFTQVCSGSSFNNNSSGYGTQELNASNDGCLSGENQSAWYKVSIQSTGSFRFTINPNDNNDDFDFAVWGPGGNCPPTTAPIRCSWAILAGTGNTGVNSANNSPATDNSEGAGGNQWTQDINATAGDVYTVMVDNYSGSTNGFQLSFGGTSVISCVPLPVEFLGFSGQLKGDGSVVLDWSTGTETNNDHFEVERTSNGVDFKKLGEILPAESPGPVNLYSFTDYFPDQGVNYYRIRQVDFNGDTDYSSLVAVEKTYKDQPSFSFPNPLSESHPYIILNNGKEKNVSVTISDLSGRIIFTEEKVFGDNHQTYLINTREAGLRQGIYFIQLDFPSGKLSRMIVVAGS